MCTPHQRLVDSIDHLLGTLRPLTAIDPGSLRQHLHDLGRCSICLADIHACTWPTTMSRMEGIDEGFCVDCHAEIYAPLGGAM